MYHIPILLDKIIETLQVKKGCLYLDGTLGGGGHSEGILKNGGNLIGIDRDIDAINECEKRFDRPEFKNRYTLIKDNFKNAKDILGDKKLDGAVLDLGISSHQIDDPSRGMSYRFDSELDMRMDKDAPLSAFDVINSYPEDRLLKILFEYGEERFSRNIVRNILKARGNKPIATTKEFADLVRKSIPNKNETHPEKRAFQAIRIEVNNELRGLDKAIKDIFDCLNSGARLCILSFHSLEHRLVKNIFNELSAGCICDKSLPQCICMHMPQGKLLKKQVPSSQEIKVNSRSASATLRSIEKI
ncbi:MAG: 16S rRNA (cytosine(1402)-N(4))-methyltransferase RsmH [Firmicutes bacterium]|nr:16S rRNA (cytosine(1402)-N(4))-methyltransferase RsmH [Bacillota bacterium]